MKSLLGFLLMALVSVCFFPALTNAQDKEGVFKADGQLSKDDSKDRVRRFSVHKVHMVKMTAGQSYTIDLVSRDFDTYLRLEDSTGQELAKDDDSGGGLNARIVFRAPKDDTYRIIATTFLGGTGNYTLTVQGAGLGVQLPAAKTPFADEAIREAIKLLQAGKAKAENKADQDKIANAVTALEALAVQNKEQPILGKKEVDGSLPAKQVDFVKAVESVFSDYKAAPNELKKSSLRAERRQAISKVLGGYEIQGWSGTLVRMGTNGDGDAHIEIRVQGGNVVMVKTWNNALSDIGDSTLIKNGSPLYKTLSELSQGDKVTFSGIFVSDEKDYVRESSITERGSMLDPAFIIRFTDVKKVK